MIVGSCLSTCCRFAARRRSMSPYHPKAEQPALLGIIHAGNVNPCRDRNDYHRKGMYHTRGGEGTT